MALITLSVTDRLMDIVEEYPRGARTMGIMTGATAALLYRVVLVFPLEGRHGGLVTPEAKPGILVLQKLRALGRDVRVVALEAVFRHRLMLHLVRRYLLAQLLVAFETEFAAPLLQNHLVISGVWIMARNTLALDEDLVGTLCFRQQHVLMALITYLGCLGR